MIAKSDNSGDANYPSGPHDIDHPAKASSGCKNFPSLIANVTVY